MRTLKYWSYMARMRLMCRFLVLLRRLIENVSEEMLKEHRVSEG